MIAKEVRLDINFVPTSTAKPNLAIPLRLFYPLDIIYFIK